MSKTSKNILSMILALVFMIQLFPVPGIAAKSTDNQGDVTNADVEENYDESSLTHNASVLGEVEGLRDEAVKHFRMSDGSYILVEYDEPVHFKTNSGEWEEINNTLEKRGKDYISENGPVRKSFAESLLDGKLFEISYNDYMLGMSLVQEIENDEGITADTNSKEVKTDALESTANETVDDLETIIEPPGKTEEANLNQVINNSESMAEKDQPEEIPSFKTDVNDPLEGEKKEIHYVPVIAKQVTAKISNPSESQRKHDELKEVPVGEAIALSKNIASVYYEGVFENIDLSYQSHSNSIKESIIVSGKQEKYSYSFALDLNNLTPSLNEDGSIEFIGSDDTLVFVIPAPYMQDANNTVSDQVQYSLEKDDDQWIVTVTADVEWINAEERAFPVVIDPSVLLNGTSYVSTGCVYNGSIFALGGSTNLLCGYSNNSNLGICEVCVQVNSLPTIPNNCVPVSAWISFYQASIYASSDTNFNNGSAQPGYLTVAAYPTGEVMDNPSSLSYYLLHTTIGVNSTLTLDYKKLTADTNNSFVSWDITSEATRWLSNNSIDRGIVLSTPYAENSEHKIALLAGSGLTQSEVRPYFVVAYRNTVGIENYYTYQNASALRAGDVYISDFTTQLTAVHTDLSFASEVTPFTLSHVYNSENSGLQFTKNDSNYSNGIHTVNFSNMKMGSGWKLSAQQTIVPVTISGIPYWIYNDADGTEHFFAPTDNSNTVFRDEDGLNLELKKDPAPAETYSITDKDMNKLVFCNGYLISQIDHIGNAIHFAYNNNYSSSDTWMPNANSSTNQLVQIVSVPKEKSASTICTFTYLSGELYSITDYAGRDIYFNYATEFGQRNLKSIEHTDNTFAQYEYDSETGRIATLYDEEAKEGVGITQRFVLGRWATNQVSEFAADSVNGPRAVGNAFHAYRNSPQQTSYRFYGPDHTSDTYDDIVSFYVLDYWGRTVCKYNSDYKKWTIIGASASEYTQNDGTSKVNNRITGVSSIGMEPLNLLNNNGVEVTDSSWIAGNNPSTGTAGRSSTKTRTGYGSLKLSNTSANSSSTVSIRQGVTLAEGGTYTFTGYINTSSLNEFASANSGVYLAITNSNSVVLAKSDIINYKTVENVNSSTEDYDHGWEKVSVSYTPTATGSYYVAFIQKGASGAAYCDDLQLEKDRAFYFYDYDTTSPSVNLLKWGNSNWSGSGYSFLEEYDRIDGYSAEVQGDITQPKRLSTTIGINKPARSLSFVLSGWARANSVASAVPNPSPACWRYYGLIASLNYTDGSSEDHYVSFNKDIKDWQFTSGIIIPNSENINKIVDYITVSCAYDYNSNTARFNNISLVREPVQTYIYDANGNAITASNTYGSEDGEYNQNSNLLTSYISSSGAEHTLNYNGRLLTSDQCNSITTNYTYDDTGNIKDVITNCASNNNYLISTNDYNSDGQFLSSTTDVNGRETNFEYDTFTRNLDYISFPNDSFQYNLYNSSDRLDLTLHSGGTWIDYQYQNGQLTNLQRTSVDDNNNYTYQHYVESYDNYGNITQIAVRKSDGLDTYSDPIVLASYEYETAVNSHSVNNGRLSKQIFANGDNIQFEYDMLDRVKTATYNDGTVYHYRYDTNGRVAHQSATNLQGTVYHSYTFQYDSLGRLSHSRQYNGTTLAMTTSHVYDKADRPVSQYWQFGNNDTYGQTYVYGDATHGTDVLHSMTTSIPGTGNHTITYDYNDLHQLTQKTQSVGNSNLIRSYSYLADPQNSNQKTMKIGETKYTRGSTTLGYTYQYDSMGNISAVHMSGSPNADYQTYSYDSLGQMVSATDADLGKEYTYTYDTAGNILTSLEHPTGNGSDYAKTYHYDNDSWKDLLTSVTVNGTTKTIAYPTSNSGKVTSGTPLSWYNGSNYTFSWIKGTRLASAKKGSSTTAFYAYDMAGLRTSKTIGLVVYKYTTLSGKVMRVSWGSSWMDFTYDESGQPYALIYKSSAYATPLMYYYLLNMQGDVMALMNSSGTIVANYQYDPWGAVTVLNPNGSPNTNSSFIGNMNPLRYRGYYYDKETGFYYLQSRYYDPAIGRFISADNMVLGSGTAGQGYNLFSYCYNNPINHEDQDGHLPKWFNTAFKAVAILAVLITAIVVVSVATAGAGTLALAFASISFGTACGGLVGGFFSESKGGEFINGWCGGAANGLLQSSGTALLGPLGTIVGGGVGSGVGTAITESLNNLGRPQSQQKSSAEILELSKRAAFFGAIMSSITAGVGHSVDFAQGSSGYNSWANTLTTGDGIAPITPGFGEMMKGFFSSMDDALVYMFS